jgi:hypothetical protein
MDDMNSRSALKSAFELAMERLAVKGGPLLKLTDEQKNKIAEIERKAQAKIAELKIMNEAKSTSEPDDGKTQEDLLLQEIAKIKDRAEEEKEKIRQGKS